jgi:phosphate transport system permease protein
MNSGHYFRRRMRNRFFLSLSVVATAFGLSWLALILGTLLYEGFSSIDLALFLQSTPPPGSMGGLLNGILGSLMVRSFGVLIVSYQACFGGTLRQRHPSLRAFHCVGAFHL